jgi:hypothetical protein
MSQWVLYGGGAANCTADLYYILDAKGTGRVERQWSPGWQRQPRPHGIQRERLETAVPQERRGPGSAGPSLVVVFTLPTSS